MLNVKCGEIIHLEFTLSITSLAPLPPDAFCPACVAAAAAAVPQTPPLKPPSTWTSAAVKELKAKLRTEKDSVVTVYRGDIMTVHVPTIPEAKKVCWEFATDGYDIGFGIYFDWTPVTSRSITVHISESSDDEDEEEELEGLWRSARSRLRPTRRPFFVKTTRRNRTLMCLSASWDCRLCVDFLFLCAFARRACQQRGRGEGLQGADQLQRG